MGCHTSRRLNSQAAVDEIARRLRHIAPALKWSERIISLEDSLHLFKVGFTIERGIATKKEVCDHPNGPNIPIPVTSVFIDIIHTWGRQKVEGEISCTYTGFPWPDFLKISGAIYPGVPQVVVNTWNCSSSMILDKPKSAIIRSALSSGVRKRRFSGFKSRCTIPWSCK